MLPGAGNRPLLPKTCHCCMPASSTVPGLLQWPLTSEASDSRRHRWITISAISASGWMVTVRRVMAYGAQPIFKAIAPLNQQVHMLAAQMCELHARGRSLGALGSAAELHSLRDALLEHLKVLEKDIRP